MIQKTDSKCADLAAIVGNDALILDGRKIDGRTLAAKQWRQTVADLAVQRGGQPTPSEALLLKRAATLALLCEQTEARLLAGEALSAADAESYRRSVQALGGVLIKLGLARKSRDITKQDGQLLDAHAEAVLNAD